MGVKKALIYPYTEKQRAEFSGLIFRYTPAIYSIIHKYDFIRDFERDDYYQEAVAYAWERYHLFDAEKSSFITWLYTTCKWAVLGYRQFLSRYSKRVLSYTSAEDLPELADEEYEEDHINGLRVAILALPERKQRVIQMYLSGEDLGKRAVADGISPATYYNLMHGARRFIRENRKRFFEDIPIEERKLRVISNGRLNERNTFSKPVEMRDATTGELVKTFPSAKEAERQGFNSKNVSACLLGKRTLCGGYRWYYSGAYDDSTILRQRKVGGRPSAGAVEQLSMDGRVIKVWDSITAPRQYGFHPSGIAAVIKGRAQQHKGYKWRYAK